LIAQILAGVSPPRRTRESLDLPKLISKLCAGRFARPLLVVDVLLFSFQGSIIPLF
jgi:hypothetical protein